MRKSTWVWLGLAAYGYWLWNKKWSFGMGYDYEPVDVSQPAAPRGAGGQVSMAPMQAISILRQPSGPVVGMTKEKYESLVAQAQAGALKAPVVEKAMTAQGMTPARTSWAEVAEFIARLQPVAQQRYAVAAHAIEALAKNELLNYFSGGRTGGTSPTVAAQAQAMLDARTSVVLDDLLQKSYAQSVPQHQRNDITFESWKYEVQSTNAMRTLGLRAEDIARKQLYRELGGR